MQWKWTKGKNFEKYKTALEGIANVTIRSDGNYYRRIGRAKELENGIDCNFMKLYEHRKLEVKSSEIEPEECTIAPKDLSHPTQKIVLCGVELTPYGDVVNYKIGGNMDYNYIDNHVICKATDDIWSCIIEYNKSRLSCKYCSEHMPKTTVTKEEADWMVTVALPRLKKQLQENDPEFDSQSMLYKKLMLLHAAKVFRNDVLKRDIF